MIYGMSLGGQPVSRGKGRYGDPVYNQQTYPTYVSGGGFVMNWKIAMIFQENIPTTPLSPIDDAFVGIDAVF